MIIERGKRKGEEEINKKEEEEEPGKFNVFFQENLK